ncbi:MAG: glycosyltransferase family 2 protein [Victivallaceae bacterium]
MTLPKISVVTLSYNQGQFLEQTIKSVLEQDYPDLEYIIMDGGSTDNSVEIIKRYEQHLTYWQSQPDGGQSAAINAGFQRATGEILCWLNSDDQFTPGTLKTIGRYFYEHPDCEWVAGSIEFRWLSSGKTSIRQAHLNNNWSILNFWVYGHAAGAFCPQPSTFWRKELWHRAGGYVREDKPNSMDYELWLRFCKLAECKIISQVFSIAVLHEQCKSIGNNDIQRLETIQTAYAFAKKNGIPLQRRLIFAYERQQLAEMVYCVRNFAPRGLLFRLFNILFAPVLLWSIKGKEKRWINFRGKI